MVEIVILFEHPQRDLENTLMLKNSIEAKGYKCEVVKYPFTNPMRLQLRYRNKTKCLIVHSLYSDRVIYNLVYWIFGKVDYIFNLQCEQLRTNQDEMDVNSYSWPKNHAKEAYHVCWGKRIAEILIRSGINREKLLLTGPIQMDVWKESFSGFFMTKSELIERFSLNPNYKIALFISSFSYANLSDIAMRQLRMIRGDEEVTKFADISAASQKEILIWFKRFLSKHKDITLVYRKHPAEDVNNNTFSELMSFDNFRIISELPINEWIYNADILLNWRSTAGIEAYFARKPVIILRPVEIPFDIDMHIFKNAKFVTQYDKFEGAMMNLTDCIIDPNIVKQYYDVNKTPSYFRLCEAIDYIIKNEKKFKWSDDLLKIMQKKYVQQNMLRLPAFIYSIIIDLLRKGRSCFGFKYTHNLNVRINRRQLEDDRHAADNIEISYIYTAKAEIIHNIIYNQNKKVV